MLIDNEIKDHILDSIGEGVFTVDKNFRINFFNKAAERITGFKRKEVNGKFCKHVFKAELCFTDCPIAQVIQTNRNIFDYDTSIHKSNNEKIPIKLNASVLYNSENEPTGGIISFRDISDLIEFKKRFEIENEFHGIIGQSKQMTEIFRLIEEISDSDAPVFIHGESGTGKELIADAIVKTSSRGNKEFVKVNCSVFPSNLLGSELFGHVKGAFTDAVSNRPGRFEIADRGTIFLDEVAEMPPQMQLQLLRVLQEGTFERIGESVTRKVDVRVIGATNMDIDSALSTGKFREDLFYRLNVIPIDIPPLRERKEDIYPLVKHFLNKFSINYNKEILDVSEKVLDIFNNYKWPGNIRELENVIEYAFVRTQQNQKIDPSKLPASLRNSNNLFPASTPEKAVSQGAEKHNLLVMLEKHKWNRTTLAKELGIGRTTLWRKLKKHGLVE
ncbi:MAG: sigma 54-interacting transcriptional regulator [Ignavibacteria bacterium]|jgi:PAS domain S-box-containing protein